MPVLRLAIAGRFVTARRVFVFAPVTQGVSFCSDLPGEEGDKTGGSLAVGNGRPDASCHTRLGTDAPMTIRWSHRGGPLWVVSLWLLAASFGSAQSRATHPRPPLDPLWPEVFWIISTKCTGCHRPGAECVDLTSYEAILAAGRKEEDPLIVPGSAEESPLWEKVAWNVDATVGSPLPDEPEMPPDRHEWLTRGQLETLRRWIDSGAKQFALPGVCQPRPLAEIDFPSAKQCGACHPRQYEQWARSMHAYAQHSPVFEAFNLTLLERTGGTLGTFCSRCHTPIGTALGENGSVRNVHRSRISREGITCVVCHRRRDGVYRASGRVHVEPGKLVEGCVYGPFDDTPPQEVTAHPTRSRAYLRQSQFCAECHDVIGPNGVRLEEAFAEWLHSPAARQGITCQHCHMGPVQGKPIPESHWPVGPAAKVPGIPVEKMPLRPLSDHTFAGPDYSVLPDTEFPRKLDWMYEVDYRDEQRLTPHQRRTLLELRRSNRRQLEIAAAKRYELLRNAARLKVEHAPVAVRGDTLSVTVRVQSLFSGHHFPTGFSAERQAWVAIDVRDAVTGEFLFRSGDLDPNGDLRDAHSDAVRAGNVPADRWLFSLQNKFVALAQKGTEANVVVPVNRFVAPISFIRPPSGPVMSFGRPFGFRIAKASLPAEQQLHRTYRIPLACEASAVTVEVRLLFRHLPPNLLDRIGVPHLKPQLEIVTIDEYRTVIPVESRASLHR